jgi:hypothetical protein
LYEASVSVGFRVVDADYRTSLTALEEIVRCGTLSKKPAYWNEKPDEKACV